VPLTPFQIEVLRLLAANRNPDSHPAWLAGASDYSCSGHPSCTSLQELGCIYLISPLPWKYESWPFAKSNHLDEGGECSLVMPPY
jgi:hypothetical protein